MAAIPFIGAIAGIAAIGSFIGTSVSHWMFSDTKNEEKTTNEIKTEIKVMSSEIKQINLIEVIIVCIVVFVVLAIIVIALLAFCRKKCRKNRNDDISMQHIPRAATIDQNA